MMHWTEHPNVSLVRVGDFSEDPVGEWKADELHVKLAEQAVSAQDACNATAVSAHLTSTMQQLLRHPKCTGTDWVNSHPIILALLGKLLSLAGIHNHPKPIDLAYHICDELAKGNDQAVKDWKDWT